MSKDENRKANGATRPLTDEQGRPWPVTTSVGSNSIDGMAEVPSTDPISVRVPTVSPV